MAALVYLGEAKKIKICHFYILYIINCSLFAHVAIYFYLNGLVDCWIRAKKFGNPLLIFWREKIFPEYSRFQDQAKIFDIFL